MLCLGKGLVIILGYHQVAGPLWSGVLILLTTAPDLSHDWERSGNAACPGRGGRSAQTAGAPDLPWSPDPRGSPGPLMGSRTTCIVTGPLAKGRSRRPASGWSGADTCLQVRTHIQGRLVSILSLTHHSIHCGRWTSALMWQKPRRFFDQGALLIVYYQDSGTAGAAHAAPASLP